MVGAWDEGDMWMNPTLAVGGKWTVGVPRLEGPCVLGAWPGEDVTGKGNIPGTK